MSTDFRKQIKLACLFWLLILSPNYAIHANSSLLSDNSDIVPANNNPEPDILYTIEPFYDVNLFRLTVQLEFKGEFSGATKIILPTEYGGQVHYESIQALQPLSPNTIIENSSQPNVKIIKYVPFSHVKISYQVEEKRKGDLALGNHYQSVINKRYIHFLGETFFIVPNWSLDREYNFRIEWKHLPSNWNIANSLGVNQTVQEASLSINNFVHSIFTGGDFRILKRYIGNYPLYISVRGDWNFSDNQFGDLTADILKAERSFWNDFEYPFFLVTVLQIEGDQDQGGIGRLNSLGLFLTRDRIIDYKFKRLIAHEIFHNWIGDKIKFSNPEELLYWFKEGFADYYARLTLLRAKLITLAEFTAAYNGVLEEYFTSPVRNEKNENLANDYWTNPDINRLPYLRGDILAFNLNLVIRKNSNWTKSLDDLMRDLFERCKNQNLILSNGSLGALIRYYAGEQTLMETMRVVNSGANIKTFSSALGPCFRMQIDTKRKFWLIGEKYEIPFYELIGESNFSEKKCLDWFGVY